MRNTFSILFKIIIVLITVSCATKDTSITKTGYYWNHIDVYVDSSFSIKEAILIDRALYAWEKALDNKIYFSIHHSVKKPSLFKDREAFKDGIFIWQLDPYNSSDKNMTSKMRNFYKNFDGMFLGVKHYRADILILIRYYGINDRFYGVVLHEVGHFVGLEHVKNPKSLMHPSTGVSCITVSDAANACAMYDCVPDPECY